MDPALELWVDVEITPVTIRLAGVLDGLTCTSVVPIVQELLDEGYRDFTMQVDDLEPTGVGGSASLDAIERLVRGAGGSLDWSNRPIRLLARPHISASSGLGRHRARPADHVD
jgi:hypothetical protein